MNHAYCLEPNQCICHVGWSGPNCDSCITQPNCPANSSCDNPAGCVCPTSLDGRCRIENNPPMFNKKYPQHKMTTECFRLNDQIQENVSSQEPQQLFGNKTR